MERSKYLERLLYRDTRQVLELLTGVDTREVTTDHVELHPAVLGMTRKAVEGTMKDYRERWAKFDVRGKNVVAISGVGGEYDFDTKQATGYTSGQDDKMKMLFLGRPVPIFFHTHIHMTEKHLAEQELDRFTGPYGEVASNQYVSLFNDFMNTFSVSDLKIIENHRRYIRSMLLGTPDGYTILIDPNLSLRFPNMPSLHSKRYGNEMLELNEKLYRVAPANFESIDFDKVKNMRRDALLQFCERTGYVAFYNDDYTQPRLNRL